MDKVDILKEYQKKVVDISRRNRLLKYPKNARGISFDMPLYEFQERFGQLAEINIDFIHRDILDASLENATLFEEEQIETEKEEVHIPPTNPTGEKLLSVLSSLRLDTKRKFEEHGLHTLFLTIGRVKWKQPLAGRGSSEATKNEIDYDSPLLLVPIEIKEVKNPKKRTTIKSYTDVVDITVNPVLLLLMELEYGVKLENTEEDFSDLVEYISQLKSQMMKCFKEANIKCEITDEISIGQYSFYGQQIYEDLKNNENEMVQHEFISSLCGNEQLVQGGMDDELDPNEHLSAEEDFNVLDADVSQLGVIQRIISGNNLIVQGPPGTGKSQTIVNAVSNLLARGKTVLVVCEKQVALEVVFNRLKNKGLDRLCLPLFHHNSDKKQFAKTIIEDREYLIRNYSTNGHGELHSSLKCRDDAMASLSSYAQALGKVVSPLDKTVYWVHGELSKAQTMLGNITLPWKGLDPLDITSEDYRSAVKVLNNLGPILNVVTQEKHSHWESIEKMHFSPDFMGRVQSELKKIKTLVSECGNNVEKLAVIESIIDIKHCLFFKDCFHRILHVKSSPLSVNMEMKILDTLKTLEDIVALVSEYKEFKNGLAKKYKISSVEKISLENSEDDIIGKDATIAQCSDAYKHHNLIKENLDFIEDNINSTKVPFLIEMPIAEVVKNSDILFINPIVKRLNNWQEISSLKTTLEKLEPLNSVYVKVEDAKKVINSWAILTTEFDAVESAGIIQRFEDSYKNFFRKFSSQYKKDCKVIEGWCNNNTPKRYEEFLEITEALNSWIKLSEKLQSILDKFVISEINSNNKLNVDEVPILYFHTKKLIEWLYSENQQEIPPRIVKVIECNDDIHALREMSKAFISIKKVLDDSWRIFPMDDNLSISEMLKSQNNFYKYVSSILSLSEKVNKCIAVGEKPTVISELEEDVEILNQLYAFTGRLKKLSPEKVFMLEDKDAVYLLESLEELEIIEKALGEAVKFVAGLQGFSDVELSLNDINWFIENIIKKEAILVASMEAFINATAELDCLFESEDNTEQLERLSFSDFNRCIDNMLCDSQGLEGWMDYRKYSYQLQEMGHEWFLDTMLSLPNVNPVALFSQSLWSAWLDSYYNKNLVLREFSVSSHSQLIAAFVQYEKEVLEVNAERILRKSISSIKQAKIDGGKEERFLLKQSMLKRSHKPVRQVVMQCNSHLQGYKPCWMMSPLTLSSYIPYGEVEFDVVIFDEASQMRVEHALSSISRAKQVVVFGDEHQLPPTAFFQTASDADDEEVEESQDFESILHASKTILPSADVSLLYHYRSKFEDLIAFSNHYIYNDELITFPNPGAGIKGVEFEYVAEGVFDGGKSGTRRNIKEAERVVEMCVKCATDFPNKSIGVIAFSRSQEVAIRDVMIQWLKDNPNSELAVKLDENSDEVEEFFIKNLESVQGDERDIIILSIGYGRDKNGKVFNRFGPINGPYGYRRLNVAVTRAKEKIICVSSLKAFDISPSESSRGGKMLQSYLDYAENGMQTLEASKLRNGPLNAEPDSEFELDVQNALINRGYEVDRQIGASGFRIDLAILNPKNNQEYLLGIECDGATYHSSYSARINDRLRQEILEGLGWKIYRVWSQHWISHKEVIVEDIIKYIDQCK